MELGENYPYPIVTMEEAQQQVEEACTVIEHSLADTHVKTPFRPRSEMGLFNSSATPGTASGSIAQCAAALPRNCSS